VQPPLLSSFLALTFALPLQAAATTWPAADGWDPHCGGRFRLCAIGATVVIGVSLNYLFKADSQTHTSRVEAWGIHVLPAPAANFVCSRCPRGSGCTTPSNCTAHVRSLYNSARLCKKQAAVADELGNKGCSFDRNVQLNRIGWATSLATRYHAKHPNTANMAKREKNCVLAEALAAGICKTCILHLLSITGIKTDVWRTVETMLDTTCCDVSAAGRGMCVCSCACPDCFSLQQSASPASACPSTLEHIYNHDCHGATGRPARNAIPVAVRAQQAPSVAATSAVPLTSFFPLFYRQSRRW